MPSRRGFIAGVAALSLAPRRTWADAGDPRYLAAARMPDGSYRLFGLDGDVRPLFSIPLPGRGHAATAHPFRPEAVAFARRPGTFAIVLNCAAQTRAATLTAPPGRHFYGHGAFSSDGTRLYTAENAFELGEGRIGIWAADDAYRRVGEMNSGGIGPHELVRLPGTDTLVIANGGIDTHPDTGREKLNIPTMQPNLTYLSTNGDILEQVTLPPEMRLNSIRHLAVRDDGLVAFGCQWQGDPSDVPPLLGLHKRGETLRLLSAPAGDHIALEGYIGSVAFSRTGAYVGITAPRGNRALIFDPAEDTWLKALTAKDICGIAPGRNGHVVTTGTGATGHAGADLSNRAGEVAWDNHLIALI